MSSHIPTNECILPLQVRCRDCRKESDTNFHVVGFKCAECDSYNTVRCGTEELPEDPHPGPGGLAGIIRRVVAAAGDEDNQEGEEDESGAFLMQYLVVLGVWKVLFQISNCIRCMYVCVNSCDYLSFICNTTPWLLLK